MPGPNLIQSVGGQAQKPTHFVSIFTSRMFNGLFTNRSLLRGPLGFLYTDFYHAGTTDVLCDGLNTELSIRLTMIRRPGNPKFCSVETSGAIDSFYGFHQANGNISVIADSLINVDVVTPSSITSIFTKTSGAGEGYFQGVDESLYIGDGIDLVKYIPGVVNPVTGAPIWNWGGAAPTSAPVLTITQTGSAGVAWAASTFFSTMGLLVDSNNNIEFLVSTMQNGNTTQFGVTGNGGPNFSTITGVVTSDNTCNWTCAGPLGLWTPGTVYNAQQVIWDPTTDWIFVSSGGTSGNTRPKFNPTINTSTADPGGHGMIWAAVGPAQLWQPSTTYNAYWEFINNNICTPVLPTTAIFAAGTPIIYVQENNVATVGHVNNPGTSGTGYSPVWSTVVGGTTNDNDLLWINLGSKNWAADTEYSGWYPGATTFSTLVDGNGNFQVCLSTGASQGTTPYNGWRASHSFAANSIIAIRNIASPTGYTAFKNEGATGNSGSSEPTWNFTTSSTTSDSGVTWTSLGPTTAGVPVWGQTYGAQTSDGITTWVCVGTAANSTWATSTTWYLPAAGFAPPSASQPYGGANVVGSGYNQFVTQSGKSGTPTAPSWSTTIGNTTTDNQITWTTVSAFNAAGFTWTKGYGYVYSFKARGTSDPYVTTSPPLQIAGTNSPNIIGPLGPPTGCQDGSITTASPVGFFTGPQLTGAQVTVSGVGSADPQFDTVEIYRSTDGFGTSGPYLFLTDIAMPPIVNGAPGVWSVIDFMPDTPSLVNGVTLPGLNELIIAPIDDANDPPPGQFGSLFFTPASTNTPTVAAAGTGLIGVTYHQGRLFGFVGNNVFASGGPDTVVGNGFTAWPPTNQFPFNSNVKRLLSTTSGLLVFCTTGLYIIAGGPAIGTYYSQLLVDGLGLLSWNALTLMAGIPYVFTADRQLIGIEPGTGIIRAGHPIGDLLSRFNPANVYLTYHSYGDQDHALFISDGATQWYRCDTNLAPDSQSVGPVWSPKATIAGGFQALASIETSPGTKQLLIGPPSAGYILARDSTFNIFSDGGTSDTGDGGTPYDAFFTMGNIVLASAGQMAEMGFICTDFIKTGSLPTVSWLRNELSATNGATFEVISNDFTSDPPKLYGPTATPATMWSNRYKFSQTTPGNIGGTPTVAWCKHLQLKVDFGSTDTVQNEMLAFTIWGALWQEK